MLQATRCLSSVIRQTKKVWVYLLTVSLVFRQKGPRDKWQYKVLAAESDWINEIFHSYYNSRLQNTLHSLLFDDQIRNSPHMSLLLALFIYFSFLLYFCFSLFQTDKQLLIHMPTVKTALNGLASNYLFTCA